MTFRGLSVGTVILALLHFQRIMAFRQVAAWTRPTWRVRRCNPFLPQHMPPHVGVNSFHSRRLATERTDENVATDTAYTNKLPRMLVGPVPTEPIVLQDLHQLTTLTRTPSPISAPLAVGSIVPLTLDQSHYVTSVLRLTKKPKASASTGATARKASLVRLWNACGDEWLAELQVLETDTTPRKRKSESPIITAICRQQLRSNGHKDGATVRTLDGWLWVAPPKKKERLRWMVEKATELNVAGFMLLDTDHSEEADLDSPTAALGKLPTYTVEAAEQCERLSLPYFATLGASTTTKLSDLLKQWLSQQPGIIILACRERSTTSRSVWSVWEQISRHDTASTTASTTVAFVVGPEGGWSLREEEQMNQLARDFPCLFFNVSLGSTILRSETAAVTALASLALYCDHVPM